MLWWILSGWTMFSFLSGRFFGVKLLGHMAIYVLRFKKLPNCFPMCLYHSTFLSATYEGFDFSTFSPTPVVVCLFYYRQSSRYLVGMLWFLYTFPSCLIMLSTFFHVLISSLYTFFFGEMSIQVSPVFLLGCLCSYYEF